MSGARIRICFQKTEEGRFLSHLDLTRAMERSLRRIDAPLAFSEGFNPHIKMSFASALAVGSTGRREYLDLDLSEEVDIETFSKSLKEALPPAIAFVGAREISESAKSLSSLVNLATYSITVDFFKPESERRINERVDESALNNDESPDSAGWFIQDEQTRDSDPAVSVTRKVREGIEEILRAGELWRKPKQLPGKKISQSKEVRGLIHRLELIEALDPRVRPECQTSAEVLSESRDQTIAAALSESRDLASAETAAEPEAPLGEAKEGFGSRRALGAAYARIVLEADLIMAADGHLRPAELWEMIKSFGGVESADIATIDRLDLQILRDGKTFSPMDF